MTKDYIKRLINIKKEIDRADRYDLHEERAVWIGYLLGYIEALEVTDGGKE